MEACHLEEGEEEGEEHHPYHPVEEAEAGAVRRLMVRAWVAWEVAAGEHVLRAGGAPEVLAVPVVAEEARWLREGEVVEAPGWPVKAAEVARSRSGEAVLAVVPGF